MLLNLKNKGSLILLAFVGLFCEKEEIAIAPHSPGDEMVNEIEIGEDYGNQLFFDLGTNTVVSSNLKSDWDLGFESNGNNIIINGSKGMAVHRSDLPFADITSHVGLDWNWDAHSGNLDSTAVGNWQIDNKVYVVDRGYDATPQHQGYFKFQIDEFVGNKFKIQYAELSSLSPNSLEIETDELHQFIYFNFEDGIVSVAPDDTEYDLVFTQYTHLFTDPETPYLVTGVLLNRVGTSAARIEGKTFGEIDLEDAQNTVLSNNINVIGYDWKWFDFEAGTYLVDPNLIYIVQTHVGIYYKLHFTSFYNSAGLKGYPRIEFQEL